MMKEAYLANERASWQIISRAGICTCADLGMIECGAQLRYSQMYRNHPKNKKTLNIQGCEKLDYNRFEFNIFGSVSYKHISTVPNIGFILKN